MVDIFISYRRKDSKAYAGRLFDRLKERFGKEHVFMDIARIVPGSDFAESIEKALGSCGALLVVIGKQWLNILDTNGHRRLENPKDFIRLELITALRSKIHVIPVLVDNAGMPTPEDLPEGLEKLGRLQALELSDRRWDVDVGELIEVLTKLSERSPVTEQITGVRQRSYLEAALIIFIFTGLPFGLFFFLFLYKFAGLPIEIVRTLSITVGLLFGSFMGLVFAFFAKGETITINFTSRDDFVTRLNVVLSEMSFNPSSASGNFLSFKPSFKAGLLSGRISVVMRGSTASITGAVIHIKKLQKRLVQ